VKHGRAKGAGSTKFAVNTDYVEAVWQAGGDPMLAPCLDLESWNGRWPWRMGFLFIGGKDYHPEAYGEALSPKIGVAGQAAPRFRSNADAAGAKLWQACLWHLRGASAYQHRIGR